MKNLLGKSMPNIPCQKSTTTIYVYATDIDCREIGSMVFLLVKVLKRDHYNRIIIKAEEINNSDCCLI